MSFYTAEQYFERLASKPKTCAAPEKDRSAFLSWQKRARKKLASLLKLDPIPTSEPEVRFLETAETEDYTRRHAVLTTEPGVEMPFYILLPKTDRQGKLRAVIAPHGHGFGGKEGVAGVRDNVLVREAAEVFNASYGEMLVKKGFAVFVPDARGFGERRERDRQGAEQILDSCCQNLKNTAEALGRTLAGMFVFDLMRLVDYVFSLDYIDKSDVACCGLSGGGMQTLMLAALDGRIKSAIVSGYYYGYQKAIALKPQCACNYVPDLFSAFDMGDIGCMIAPRRLFIETGSSDPLNGGIENALGQIEYTRKRYALLGAEHAFTNKVYDGGHRFYGTDCLDWLLK